MYSAAISSSSIDAAGPSLEQHRLVGAPDLRQQVEVLHVARADLDHVGMLEHGVDVPRVHQLGDDRQPGLLARLDEDRQGLFAETAEGVRRRPRLEGAAAQHRRAGVRDRTGRLERLLPVLDRAGPGDQAEGVISERAAVHLDHGRIRRELARDQLVRLEDR
jgi:hypothetical protein